MPHACHKRFANDIMKVLVLPLEKRGATHSGNEGS